MTQTVRPRPRPVGVQAGAMAQKILSRYDRNQDECVVLDGLDQSENPYHTSEAVIKQNWKIDGPSRRADGGGWFSGLLMQRFEPTPMLETLTVSMKPFFLNVWATSPERGPERSTMSFDQLWAREGEHYVTRDEIVNFLAAHTHGMDHLPADQRVLTLDTLQHLRQTYPEQRRKTTRELGTGEALTPLNAMCGQGGKGALYKRTIQQTEALPPGTQIARTREYGMSAWGQIGIPLFPELPQEDPLKANIWDVGVR